MTAQQLIARLALQPHPEGGYFGEVFRSSAGVTTGDGRGERRALTTIYYLLPGGDVSRWHRVRSDEVWHFYEGAPLELLVLDSAGERLARHELGAVADGRPRTVTVAAGEWQAARSTGAFSLAGCTVGPGFEYADFSLARDVAGAAAAIRQHHPALALFL